MAGSKDYGNLRYFWVNWRNAVGIPMKNKYVELIGIANEAARLNGKIQYLLPT